MRVIAGSLKGRKLKSPADESVRPTADKVKEAIFSMLMPYLNDSIVIDLFAGSGGLGLEALSRGAKRAYFVDKDRRSIALIRDNVKICGMEDCSVIMCADHASAVNRIHEKADIVFLDPPYRAGLMTDCISLLSRSGVVPEGGIVIAEHSRDEVLPENISDFVMLKEKRYGKTVVSVYEREEED